MNTDQFTIGVPEYDRSDTFIDLGADQAVPERFSVTVLINDGLVRLQLQCRPQPDAGPWDADDNIVIAEIEKIRFPGGVTSSKLRDLPLQRIALAAVERATYINRGIDPGTGLMRGIPLSALPEDERMNALEATRRRHGRRQHRLNDVFLAEVARTYAAAYEAGGDPTSTVATQFIGAASTAARWVMRAREKGFLTKTTMGRPGGHLTDRAKAVLDGEG